MVLFTTKYDNSPWFYKWLCLPQNMTIKGGTNQACARCKYQRRKCTSECVLAPYFPPDQPKIFQNAHKLFGVSNILKIIKDLDETQRMEAMRSIVYESNIRDKFPVHGCLGVILQYQYQIQQLEEELYLVQSQIAYYRQQAVLNDSSQLPLGIMPTVAPESQNALALFETPQNVSPISTWPIGSYSANANLNLDQNDSTKSSNVWIQQPCSDVDNKNNQLALNSQLPALNIQQDVIEDYEFFDTVNDRQSYIHPKDACCESSSESSMKNTRHSLEHIAENELKSAAACFSLTNTLAWQKDRRQSPTRTLKQVEQWTFIDF